MRKPNYSKVIYTTFVFIGLLLSTVLFQNFTVISEPIADKSPKEDSLDVLRAALAASDKDHAASTVALHKDLPEKVSADSSLSKKRAPSAVDETPILNMPIEENDEEQFPESEDY